MHSIIAYSKILMFNKIFFSILFISAINTSFASFPVFELEREFVCANEDFSKSDSSVYGNLSLILSLFALLPLLDIGFFGWPLLFLSVPAVVLGVMSIETKARLKGIIGSVIGFLHIVYWGLIFLLFSSLFGY